MSLIVCRGERFAASITDWFAVGYFERFILSLNPESHAL